MLVVTLLLLAKSRNVSVIASRSCAIFMLRVTGAVKLLAFADGFVCLRDFIRTSELFAQKSPTDLLDLRDFFHRCIFSGVVNPDTPGSPLP